MISEGGDGKSGGERAALQTLRAARNRLAVAKRLDCGGFSTAFRARDGVGNRKTRSDDHVDERCCRGAGIADCNLDLSGLD